MSGSGSRPWSWLLRPLCGRARSGSACSSSSTPQAVDSSSGIGQLPVRWRCIRAPARSCADVARLLPGAHRGDRAAHARSGDHARSPLAGPASLSAVGGDAVALDRHHGPAGARVSDPGRSARLIGAIRRMLNTPGNPPQLLPGGDDGLARAAGWAGDAIFARRAAPVRNVLLEELRERRRGGTVGDDVHGAMLQPPEISDEAIVDQLLVVLMAAREPPSIALTNVIFELARAPGIAGQFRASPSSRRAIIAEVLRLRPSAFAVLRRLTSRWTWQAIRWRPGRHRAQVRCCTEIRGRFPNPTPSSPAALPSGLRRTCPTSPSAKERAAAWARRWPVWPRPERMVIRATVLVPYRGALVSAMAVD
jgi:hypothetical protein